MEQPFFIHFVPFPSASCKDSHRIIAAERRCGGPALGNRRALDVLGLPRHPAGGAGFRALRRRPPALPGPLPRRLRSRVSGQGPGARPGHLSRCRLLRASAACLRPAGPPEAILVCPVFVSRGCDKGQDPRGCVYAGGPAGSGPGPVRRMNSEGDNPFCQARRRPSLQPGVYRGNKVIGQVGPGAPASRASAVRSGQSRASARAA